MNKSAESLSTIDLKESITNYDKIVNRIKTIFAHKDWSIVKRSTE